MGAFTKKMTEETTSPSKVYQGKAKYNAKYSDKILWAPPSSATTSTICFAESPKMSTPCTCQNSPGARTTLSNRPSVTVQTRYMDMLLGLDTIPTLHKIYAALFTWLLLAGYIVFPATFTTLNTSSKVAQAAANGTEIERDVLNTVKNAPVLYIAVICCIIGAIGMIALWWRWKHNYIWVINHIFQPGLLNSIIGLINSLVNVYAAQNGDFSVTAKVTIIATAICTALTAALFLLYNNLALERVRKEHEEEVSQERCWVGNKA